MEETMRSLEDVQETYYLMLAWLVFCICYWFISETGETLLSQPAVYFPWLFAKCCILVMKKVQSCHCMTGCRIWEIDGLAYRAKVQW